MSTENRRWVVCGGIGSGKSTVRRMLEEQGFTTIDADSVGHEVISPGGGAFGDVAERWPQVVRDGEIDRRALAAIVFSDQGELAILEEITHPHIFDTISTRVQRIDGQVVVEVPLIRHGLGDTWRRMVVDAPDEVRLARAIGRGITEDDARSRMASQPSRGEWLAVADLVIPNDRSLDELRTTLEAVEAAI